MSCMLVFVISELATTNLSRSQHVLCCAVVTHSLLTIVTIGVNVPVCAAVWERPYSNANLPGTSELTKLDADNKTMNSALVIQL